MIMRKLVFALAFALGACTVVAPPGTTPPVVTPPSDGGGVVTPPVVDANQWPVDVVNGVAGVGSHSVHITSSNWGDSHLNFVFRCDNIVMTKPFAPPSRSGMIGGDVLTINSPFCKLGSKMEVLGVPPNGLQGGFFNEADVDYNPLNFVGDWDSRGGGRILQGPGAYVSNGTNVLSLASPGVIPLPPPPPPAVAPKLIEGATINGAAHAPVLLADLVKEVPEGGTSHVPAVTVHESVGIAPSQTVESDGKILNPGTKGATFAGGAILDGNGVPAYREGQGGFVPLAGKTTIRGWEVTGFGLNAGAHDGTGGVRNNRPGDNLLEESYIHHNQMGIGPHDDGESIWRLHNVLSIDNGLKNDPGYAHNFYFGGLRVVITGGVTSIAHPGSGDGHALKSRAKNIDIDGVNYFAAYGTSSIDIPNGTVDPINWGPGTVVEKFSGDENRVIFGYGPEGPTNGNAGGVIHGWTWVVPNDGQQYYFILSATITCDGCKFLYTDGTPVKPGTFVAQGAGQMIGLPQ